MFPKCLDEAKRMSSVPFRELVGGLQCVAQCTRQEHSQPMQSAVSAAIHEKPSGRQSDDRVKNSATGIQMHDPETRRSVSGYKFVHLGGAVAWSCRSQSTIPVFHDGSKIYGYRSLWPECFMMTLILYRA